MSVLWWVSCAALNWVVHPIFVQMVCRNGIFYSPTNSHLFRVAAGTDDVLLLCSITNGLNHGKPNNQLPNSIPQMGCFSHPQTGCILLDFPHVQVVGRRFEGRKPKAEMHGKLSVQHSLDSMRHLLLSLVARFLMSFFTCDMHPQGKRKEEEQNSATLFPDMGVS